MSFPTTISPWGLHADVVGNKILNIAVMYVGEALDLCKLQQGRHNVNSTAKVLRLSVKLESKHAVEKMLHWLVRIIFCFN